MWSTIINSNNTLNIHPTNQYYECKFNRQRKFKWFSKTNINLINDWTIDWSTNNYGNNNKCSNSEYKSQLSIEKPIDHQAMIFIQVLVREINLEIGLISKEIVD